MTKFDDCVAHIIALASSGATDAVPRAKDSANEHLVPYGLAQAGTERIRLVKALREAGPKSPLMTDIILAIETGA
jgi:hypothetical protein